jgi:hypothetical protein
VTPEQRSQRARIAALTRWSREDPTIGTQKALDAFLQRFLTEVDPTGSLPEDERARRAQRARRAHMLTLASRSAKARRRA